LREVPGHGREGGEAIDIVKVIELLGESEQGWEDAAQQVVSEATRTLHGVTEARSGRL